ncbi:hypothetical protein [Methanobacterium spitsbergense]|uniref:Uncharacterized protein n=1 Tax=Methanobacterium spitsbergense TaxID=2874285 RepID=A0A8T5V572_9EURY|nr:hypothetical protein [Methanobacterium spitsbergense]MBZ2167041.1 hypothetical protein [Methanobacterium spitsbergense]
MGILDVYQCPNTDCWWSKNTGKKGEHCPECGTELKKVGFREGAKITAEKDKLKNDPETYNRKQAYKEEQKALKVQEKEEKRLAQLLFSTRVTDDDLKRSIESDMSNLASHEAGTKWMRVGTLLSFNSTEQMIGAGFKAIIDQNKIKIKQNELILRELKKLNSK